ncbi:hypothetical protein [Geobacter sp. AOG1]|uniref:hypothetical protein n=1 Tax=Geobacter sp. AOG1 TaxID=1566346 RepID=UPI001CC71863|nr:hypothetical protein [Geobacter sp. AOG1]GFE58621.1 hypothetical protein AOG1_25010 [Geobacter sp. AOG1]
MNKRVIEAVRAQTTLFLMALILLTSCGFAYGGTSRENNQALLLPPSQEDQAVLTRRLQTAKRDIEAFRIFAENFRSNGDSKALAQLQYPVDDFLKKHVDNLLAQSMQLATLETIRLTAEIMFIKARVFLYLNRGDAARSVVAEMKNQFGSYQKMSVELPGKTTTLDEGIRLLDEELAKAVTTERK